MKKILFCAMALLSVIAVSAQTAEEMEASKQRMEKLTKLTQPKATGIGDIDNLVAASAKVAAESVEITPLIQNIYNQAGDVTKYPSLTELTGLGERIKKQTEQIEVFSPLLIYAGKPN